jgi:hypothetical protein
MKWKRKDRVLMIFIDMSLQVVHGDKHFGAQVTCHVPAITQNFILNSASDFLLKTRPKVLFVLCGSLQVAAVR